MATVDHPHEVNAPYPRTPPKTETSLLHSRNLSNVTLFTTTTAHSPTEPLLHATTPQSVNFDDQPDHIPSDDPTGHLPCEAPLVIHDNPMNKTERRGYWARNCRRTLIRRKWLKLGLRAVLCEFSPNLADTRPCRSLSIVLALPAFFLSDYRRAHLLFFFSYVGHLQHGPIFYCIFEFRCSYLSGYLSCAWNQYRRLLFIVFFLLPPCHPQWAYTWCHAYLFVNPPNNNGLSILILPYRPCRCQFCSIIYLEGLARPLFECG